MSALLFHGLHGVTYIRKPIGKGLAEHLQVPLPYLLHRAQTRYEEDLRGLQGIRGALSPASALPPSTAFPTSTNPLPSPVQAHANGQEYFARVPESSRLTSSSSRPPLGVRARLSSLGANQSQRLRLGSIGRRASQRPDANGSKQVPPRPSKKVSSSSTLTLQGPRRSHTPRRPLSRTSSRSGSGPNENGAEDGGDDGSAGEESENEVEEQARQEEEAEQQEALARKLRDLERLMTKDQLGLVSSTSSRRHLSQDKAEDTDKGPMRSRGRMRPLSASSFSSRSQQSLSSLSSRSPAGSVPSSPPYPPASVHWRSHPETRRHSEYVRQSTAEQLHSPAPEEKRIASPIPRHLSPPGKSSSPPALSATHVRAMRRASAGAGGTVGMSRKVGGRVSEQGSEASSFSDLSGECDVCTLTLEQLLIGWYYRCKPISVCAGKCIDV